MTLDLALLGGLVYTFINFLKYLSTASWVQARTQAIVWGGGIGGIFLLGATQFGGLVKLNGVELLHMNGWDKLLLGLMSSSLFASVPQKLIKAIDQHDTAAVPPLVGPKTLRRMFHAAASAAKKPKDAA